MFHVLKRSRVVIRKMGGILGFCLVLCACGGAHNTAPFVPNRPQTVDIFEASTRPESEDVTNTVRPHYTFLQISIPPGHQVGDIERPTFGAPSVGKHFKITLKSPMEFEDWKGEIASHLSGRVGPNRDILIYTHGFNTSLEEARFRLSQIVADGRFGGVAVLLTWPSKGALLSYVPDKERATASRDDFAKVLGDLSRIPDVGRIHVLAHSMGAWLIMEALREQAIAGHPDLEGRLGEVMLAAPDIDLSVFQQQMARLAGRARVSIFVSNSDRALALSGTLSGEQPRLGALNPSNPEEREELKRLGVRVYDLSSFSHAWSLGHGTYADAPSVIEVIGAQLTRVDPQESTKTSILTPPREENMEDKGKP